MIIIIGLAVALEVTMRFAHLHTLSLKKEDRVGEHQSARKLAVHL